MRKERLTQEIRLPFYKIEGAGNDMIVFFGKDLPLKGSKKSQFLCGMADRRLGIGCDQFLEIVSLDFLEIKIWNSDGSSAEMCANGARSFLFLAKQEGWVSDAEKLQLKVSGRFCEGEKKGLGYAFCLGEPKVESHESLLALKEKIAFYRVNAGNPHAIILMGGKNAEWKAKKDFSYLRFGPVIESHKKFPKKTNVEFVRDWKIQKNQVVARVETWERGAGPTLSCGSGAVAVACLLREKTMKDLFTIKMNQFDLVVEFRGRKAYLSGPSKVIAQGTYRY
ncbi:MAG: diaminopimelate epimerase [Oligoflexia bacterium]|nr:diaminopimelate epimerase [Oligoflexia bacterium]